MSNSREIADLLSGVDVTGTVTADGLVVGATALPTDDNTTLGFGVTSSGEVRAAVNNGNAAMFKRATSDGDIIEFRKDSTAVGSIGVNSTTPYMSGNLGGFRLTSSSGAGVMIPTDTSGNSSDADNDLGISGTRWRDLYLAGGVYLGGTGSANKLDDYEEGTWTPTGTNLNTPYTCHYTKIGNQVHCKGYIQASGGSSSAVIGGLPFAIFGSTGSRGSGSVDFNNSSANQWSILNLGSGTTFNFYYNGAQQTITNGKSVYFHLTYFTTA